MNLRLLMALFAVSSLGCLGPGENELARCPTGPTLDAVVIGGLVPNGLGDAAKGAALFDAECTKCHSPRVVDRSSRLFRGYPRLDCPDYLAGATDGYLATVIHSGGLAVGLDPAMKPFSDKLNTEDMADLLAYLRAPQPAGATNP